MGLNAYTQLLTYIKQLGEADPFINTITQGNFSRIDLDKGNIFPLLHVTVLGGAFNNGSTIEFNIEVVALQQRDTNKEIRTDKFWEQDNEVDNLNEMLAVLNRLWLNMYRDFQENNISASENPTLDIIEPESQTNSIEGWRMVFNVEVPNTTISLCP
jgi:hypothetical protein